MALASTSRTAQGPHSRHVASFRAGALPSTPSYRQSAPSISCPAFLSLEPSSQRRVAATTEPVGRGNSRRTSVAGRLQSAPEVSGHASTASEPADFLHEETVASGRIEIRPLSAADVPGVGVVMTRAFATTDEDISLSGAIEYVKGILNQGLKGCLLVARLFPTDATLLPPNQASRIVGLVALSFHPDAMQPCPTLPPPEGTAYLSNMAVDSKLRRQGIARALLTAAAAATTAAGHSALYLHVKQSDEAAPRLYTSSGYTELARDSMMVKLKGIKPRILMKKTFL